MIPKRAGRSPAPASEPDLVRSGVHEPGGKSETVLAPTDERDEAPERATVQRDGDGRTRAWGLCGRPAKADWRSTPPSTAVAGTTSATDPAPRARGTRPNGRSRPASGHVATERGARFGTDVDVDQRRAPRDQWRRQPQPPRPEMPLERECPAHRGRQEHRRKDRPPDERRHDESDEDECDEGSSEHVTCPMPAEQDAAHSRASTSAHPRGRTNAHGGESHARAP